jgi:hypothetical protein
MADSISGPRDDDYIVSGYLACTQLKKLCKYDISPLYSIHIFQQFLYELVNRKIQSDSEFRDNIALRELKRTHKVEIESFQNKIQTSYTEFEKCDKFCRILVLEKKISSIQKTIESIERFIDASVERNLASTVRSNKIRELLPLKQIEYIQVSHYYFCV